MEQGVEGWGTVSLRADVPEPLLEAMRAFIERHPNWDQYRLFQAALAGFLVQNGVRDRSVTRCYLANLFPGQGQFLAGPMAAPPSELPQPGPSSPSSPSAGRGSATASPSLPPGPPRAGAAPPLRSLRRSRRRATPGPSEDAYGNAA